MKALVKCQFYLLLFNGVAHAMLFAVGTAASDNQTDPSTGDTAPNDEKTDPCDSWKRPLSKLGSRPNQLQNG